MTTTLPATTTTTADTAPGAPFVQVAHDKDTGRTIIALDADATDALDDFLCNFDTQDFVNDHGCADDATAQRIATVLSLIRGKLGKHLRGWS